MIFFFMFSSFIANNSPVIICPNHNGKKSFGVRENYIFSNKCYDTTYNSTPNMFTDVIIRDTIHAHKNHNYEFKNVYVGFCPLGIIHIGYSATLSVHNLTDVDFRAFLSKGAWRNRDTTTPAKPAQVASMPAKDGTVPKAAGKTATTPLRRNPPRAAKSAAKRH